jgi:hypothetical protein
VSQSDHDLSLQAFSDNHVSAGMVNRQGMIIVVQKRDDPNDQLMVFFSDEKSVGIKHARKYANGV